MIFSNALSTYAIYKSWALADASGALSDLCQGSNVIYALSPDIKAIVPAQFVLRLIAHDELL
jgi:hypothetical protein